MIKHATKVQPGNLQSGSNSNYGVTGYTMTSGVPSYSRNMEGNNNFGRPVTTEDSLSGIERAKQLINEKFSKMVDWGHFTQSSNTVMHQPPASLIDD